MITGLGQAIAGGGHLLKAGTVCLAGNCGSGSAQDTPSLPSLSGPRTLGHFLG
jgi:hypothetical protein